MRKDHLYPVGPTCHWFPFSPLFFLLPAPTNIPAGSQPSCRQASATGKSRRPCAKLRRKSVPAPAARVSPIVQPRGSPVGPPAGPLAPLASSLSAPMGQSSRRTKKTRRGSGRNMAKNKLRSSRPTRPRSPMSSLRCKPNCKSTGPSVRLYDYLNTVVLWYAVGISSGSAVVSPTCGYEILQLA